MSHWSQSDLWLLVWVYVYLGSMPCIRISSCLHSTMSLVNIAWKYGIEAARTIRWALNLWSPTCREDNTCSHLCTERLCGLISCTFIRFYWQSQWGLSWLVNWLHEQYVLCPSTGSSCEVDDHHDDVVANQLSAASPCGSQVFPLSGRSQISLASYLSLLIFSDVMGLFKLRVSLSY